MEGYRLIRDTVDAACQAAGRDPAEVERTLALFVAFPEALGRSLGDLTGPDVTPISSDAATLARALRAFAAEGVGHVQLVLDPITVETIAALAPAPRAARRLTAAILAAWRVLPAPIPLGSSGRLEAQPLTNAVGNHAVLVREGEQPRALLTAEAGAGERQRVVIVPLDDDVELRVDGDAMAVWLSQGSIGPAPCRTCRPGPTPSASCW